MTIEDIKRIVDDERAEQLTAQLCRHWEVATKRLEGLRKELEDGMDTCAEAEIYAALMRMQSISRTHCQDRFQRRYTRIGGEADKAVTEREVCPAGILLRHGNTVAGTARRLVA